MNSEFLFSLDEKIDLLSNKLATTLGIRKKDSLIWLTLHKLGSQSVNILSQHLGINRSTVSSILDSLWQKNLIKKHPNAERTLFSACSLDDLKQYIQTQEDHLKKCYKQIHHLSPVIKEISYCTYSTIPKVCYYQGLDQVKIMLLQFLKYLPVNTEIFSYVNVAKRDISEYKGFWEEYYRIRKERNISVRQISPDTDICRLHALKDKKELRKTKLIPYEDFPMNQNYEIMIVEKKVATFSWHPSSPLLVINDDADAAKTQQNIFNHHWSLLK